MEKYQRSPYYGIHKESGREENQRIAEEIGYQRSGEKLECIKVSSS
jgi:hypothetical protein